MGYVTVSAGILLDAREVAKQGWIAEDWRDKSAIYYSCWTLFEVARHAVNRNELFFDEGNLNYTGSYFV